MGAQGSKEHSLLFQVNSKARDKGGESEPSEERSELRNLFDTPPGEAQGSPAAAVGAACHRGNTATLRRTWPVTADSLSCRETWNTVRAWRLVTDNFHHHPSVRRLGVPLPWPRHTVTGHRATLQ